MTRIHSYEMWTLHENAHFLSALSCRVLVIALIVTSAIEVYNIPEQMANADEVHSAANDVIT